MAKKDKKNDKDKAGKAVPNETVDAVRAAVERTLQAAGGTAGARERTRELIDEFGAFAGRPQGEDAGLRCGRDAGHAAGHRRRIAAVAAAFGSPREFREVMDRVFAM